MINISSHWRANKLLVVLCKYCTSLNVRRLQSDACDLTKRAAFSIGSVKVRKWATQIVRFSSGSLFAILKNMFRLRFDKINVKPVYKTPVRFDSVISGDNCRSPGLRACDLSTISSFHIALTLWTVVIKLTLKTAYKQVKRMAKMHKFMNHDVQGFAR